MLKPCDVLIVSINAKGHYIASLLSQKGYQVTLLNLPVKNLNIEDLIGPFDFFENSTNSLQEAFLNSFIHFQNSTAGFTLWSSLGPIDFQSFIKNYSLAKQGLDASNIEYLSNVNLLSPAERKDLKTHLNQLPHSQNWLSKLAHQISSSQFQLESYNLETTQTKVLPFFNKKKSAQPSQNSLKNSLTWCLKNKVQVINIDNITALKASHLVYFNSETKQEESLSAKKIIWTLSSEETQDLLPSVFSTLYLKTAKPLWQWTKFCLHLDEKYIFDFNTHSFLMINNLELNFSGDNLGIIKKTSLSNIWNLWLSVPNAKTDIKEITQAAHSFFKQRIPQLKIKKIQISSNKASLFPVFDNLDQTHTQKIKDLYFCNFETCPNLDWPNFLKFQKNMSEVISKQLPQGEIYD